jgi:peroxiredoxin Q/BCP
VLAISPQDVDSHERWAAEEGFTFPLLADTDWVAIDAYGVRAPVVGVNRSVFLVDSAGIVRWRYTGTVRAIFKRPKRLAKILAKMD